MRISDWSSDVCSSDLLVVEIDGKRTRLSESGNAERADCTFGATGQHNVSIIHCDHAGRIANAVRACRTGRDNGVVRSEEHTSELQSLMRISYAVFCLKKKTTHHECRPHTTNNKQSSHTKMPH